MADLSGFSRPDSYGSKMRAIPYSRWPTIRTMQVVRRKTQTLGPQGLADGCSLFYFDHLSGERKLFVLFYNKDGQGRRGLPY